MLTCGSLAMLRLLPGQGRSFPRNVTLAIALSLVAGAVNASGLLAAGAMTSHMTGNLTRVGEGIALGTVSALQPAGYLASFLAGAFLATLSMSTLVRRGLREPVPSLLLVEAALLAAVATSGWFLSRPLLVTELLCLAMGWQNALITHISGAVVRTTHMTGATTDLGIELGRLLMSRPKSLSSWPSRGLVRWVRAIPPESDGARAALHLSAITFLLLGATLGPLLFVRYGYKAMFAPVAVLLAIVAANQAFPRRPDEVVPAVVDV